MSGPLPQAHRRGASSGFTLIETLVALTLLSVAMFLTLSLIYQEPRVKRRLDAHAEAVRGLELTLEAIRAGRGVALGRQQHFLYQPDPLIADELKIWTVKVAVSGSGLYRLTLTADYRVGQHWFDQSLETMVWRPL